MDVNKDINYLLHRQQVSLIKAQVTGSQEGRVAYEGLARGYTDRIVAYRQENRDSFDQAH